MTLTFNYYSVANNPIQHIRHFQDKMVVYSRNDQLFCSTFPSSLNFVASDWFYSPPPRSLQNFEEVTEAFLTLYVSSGIQEE